MDREWSLLLTWQFWVFLPIFYAVVVWPANLLEKRLASEYRWARRVPWPGFISIVLLAYSIVVITTLFFMNALGPSGDWGFRSL